MGALSDMATSCLKAKKHSDTVAGMPSFHLHADL